MYGECKEAWQELMNDTRNWGVNGANKHKKMYQKLCQKKLGERVYLNQRAAMRAGLKYEGQDHKKATKLLYTVSNLMIYLADNAAKFTEEEIYRNIIPAMLKPRTQVEYVNMGDEDLAKKQDVVSLLPRISRGIGSKIDAGGARKCTPKYKSGYDSSSESDSGHDNDGCDATDTTKTLRTPTCAAYQAITMPGRTA